MDEQVHLIDTFASLDKLGEGLHVAGTVVQLLAGLVLDGVVDGLGDELVGEHLGEATHCRLDYLICKIYL